MTYGLDQCRLCGKDMPLTDSEALNRYEVSKRQRPTMTEVEWRAAGWLAAPTRHQMQHTLDGLCYDCKFQRGSRRFGFGKVALYSLLIVLVVLSLVFIGLRTLL